MNLFRHSEALTLCLAVFPRLTSWATFFRPLSWASAPYAVSRSIEVYTNLSTHSINLDLLKAHVRVCACDLCTPRALEEIPAVPFRLYHPKLICVFVMRIVLAAGLALALLAGVVPASLSSTQQTCTMSCCAGKPMHAAGSCSHAFSDERETQTHSPTASEDQHHHTEAIETDSTATAAPEIIEADASTSSHCGTTAQTSAESASTGRAARPPQPPQPPSIRAHVLIRPCSPECAAAAVSNLSQVRRGRSVAVLTAKLRPRPPTLASLTEQTFQLQTSPAVICRQSRPRAPPTATHQNTSA
jgi:hypothetical protein